MQFNIISMNKTNNNLAFPLIMQIHKDHIEL